MIPQRDERHILVQMVRDGVISTSVVPTDPDDRGDELAAAVAIVKLLKVTHGERVDYVLESIFDYRMEDKAGAFDLAELN